MFIDHDSGSYTGQLFKIRDGHTAVSTTTGEESKMKDKEMVYEPPALAEVGTSLS